MSESCSQWGVCYEKNRHFDEDVRRTPVGHTSPNIVVDLSLKDRAMKLLHFKGANMPKSLVEYFVKEGEVARVQFGSATIMPGGRLPGESYRQHNCHSEISYIITGTCRFHADGEVVVLDEGDVLYNPRGSRHFVINLNGKPCVVFGRW